MISLPACDSTLRPTLFPHCATHCPHTSPHTFPPCSLLEPLLGTSQSHEQGDDHQQLTLAFAPLLRRAAQSRSFALVRKVEAKLAGLGRRMEPTTYADCMVAAATVSARLLLNVTPS